MFPPMDIIIPAGATGLSDAIDLENAEPGALFMSAVWQAAAITFVVAPTPGGTYNTLRKDDGTEVTLTVAASQVISLAGLRYFAGARYIKFRSGTAALAVDQTAARTLQLTRI